MVESWKKTQRSYFDEESWGGKIFDAGKLTLKNSERLKNRLMAASLFEQINTTHGLKLPGSLPPEFFEILTTVLEPDFREQFKVQIGETIRTFKELNSDKLVTAAQIAKFRAKLKKVLNETWDLAGNELKLALDRFGIDIELKQPLREAFEDTLDNAPDWTLRALYRGLNTFPQAINLELDDIKKALKIIKDSNSCDLILKDDHEERLGIVLKAGTVAKGLEMAYNFAAEHMPRDLSATVEVVGEGAGTELIGSPARWLPMWIGTIFKYVGLASDQYLEKYDRCILYDIRSKVSEQK